MLCPHDGATLLMSERQGVEVDYCPTCRGVWLDRGELDKIIERGHLSDDDDADDDRDRWRGSSGDVRMPQGPPIQQRFDHDDRYRKRKKRSFLDDIFDFD